MKEKTVAFKEFTARLSAQLDKVDFSNETSKERLEMLSLEKLNVNASESYYKSTSSHLKRQFSL